MKFFGFEIKKEKSDTNLLKVSTDMPDGSQDIEVIPGSASSFFIDFNYHLTDEAEIIQWYRDTASLSSVDDAITEIVNEAIVVQDQEKIVEIILSETEFSSAIQKKITDEFNYLLNLLNFNDQGDQIFRQWYIDGRQYYHKVVSKGKEKEGIKEINWLDPKKTTKIREMRKETIDQGGKKIEVNIVDKEYFLYNPQAQNKEKRNPQIGFSAMPQESVLQLTPDSVAFITSGIIDYNTGRAQSYLHTALKPAQQLSLLEDSLVVYRLTRAPERRIFYIDVGNLPSGRAEQHVLKQMNRYKNKLVYNTKTGAIDAAKAHISMMEDIWLPRREGGKSTEVTTLPAGQNLGSIEDIVYFKRKLAQAMNVPESRLDSQATFQTGVNGEIKRDELKFSKFVDKLRRRFNNLFYDLLKTQLVLKAIITDKDWDDNRQNIRFKYNRDSYVGELQEAEMWLRRLELLDKTSVYTGKDKYFSQRWNEENVLKISEEEKRQIEKDWADEPEEPAYGPIGPAGLETGMSIDADPMLGDGTPKPPTTVPASKKKKAAKKPAAEEPSKS
jgi:hypothetical protein